MAANPAMLEAWMNTHVGRHGGIVAWRLIGTCSALAVSMDSTAATSAAVRSLGGSTLLMRPVTSFFLEDFPHNEQLAEHVQKVTSRMVGSGAAYMEAMSATWQKIQELPPAEWRRAPQLF